MTSYSPSCSVVIRCFNEEQSIGRLLIGLSQQTVIDIEIILVDSGSTDATLSIASQFDVNILSISRDDFSFGRSLNYGFEAASGELVVVASAHVYPLYRDWIACLVAPLKDPRISAVYGKQRGNDSSKYAERQVFRNWYPDHTVHEQDHPFCNNANAAVRRSIWAEAKYNESLTGLEDLEWAKRSMEKGFTIAYAADAEVVHVHDESLREIFNRYRREALAMKIIYPEARFGLRDFLRLSLSNIVSDLSSARKDGVLAQETLGVWGFRVVQFAGTYKGFKERQTNISIDKRLRMQLYYPNHNRRGIRPADIQDSHPPVEYDRQANDG